MRIELVRVDYHDSQHAGALVMLLDAYARDPMGGGRPLNGAVRQRLVPELARRSDALSVLAHVDGQPAGMVNAFEGFSTFNAKPLLNIHDVFVLPDYRGAGLAKRMLAYLESIAIERGCCKLTLEVLSHNTAAQSAYRRYGFEACTSNGDAEQTFFWQKTL